MDKVNVTNLVNRESLLRKTAEYLQLGDEHLLTNLHSLATTYMNQGEMRLVALRELAQNQAPLENILGMMEGLASAEKYYLFGTYLLAKNLDGQWDTDQILEAIVQHCAGCISWLYEDEKDFLGYVALNQADYLSQPQMIRLITVIDSYFIRTDILNRLIESQEPSILAKLRRKLVGRHSLVNKCPDENYTGVFRKSSTEEALEAFENDLLIRKHPAIEKDMASPLCESDLKTIFSSIEKLGLRTPEKIYSILDELKKWEYARDRGQHLPEGLDTDEVKECMERVNWEFALEPVESLFPSYVEYTSVPVENWFGYSLSKLGNMNSLGWSPEDKKNLARYWNGIDSSADEHIAKINLCLVLLLRATLHKGTTEQVKKVLAFLSPATLAQHAKRLQKIDPHQLFKIMTDMGFSSFAIQKVIAPLKLNDLPFDKLTQLLPFLVDDKAFLDLWLQEASKHEDNVPPNNK